MNDKIIADYEQIPPRCHYQPVAVDYAIPGTYYALNGQKDKARTALHKAIALFESAPAGACGGFGCGWASSPPQSLDDRLTRLFEPAGVVDCLDIDVSDKDPTEESCRQLLRSLN